MSEDQILNPRQRQETAEWLGAADAADVSDEELLTRAADRIGLEGELAIDEDGVLELERDDLLVILEEVTEEDAALVDHPELLHLSVYLRPASPDDRTDLVEADLLEEDAEAVGDEGWTYAWWGAMCTQLPKDVGLPTRLEALHRAMEEAAALLERRDLPAFFNRMRWLELESDDS